MTKIGKYNKNIYCTLFNEFYLDKALVMINSLRTVTDNSFELYVFAMTKICYQMLSKLSLNNVIVIDVESLETEEWLKIKKERSGAEYCWTWTPNTIKYVLKNYNVPLCTYIDADLFFYSDPAILIQEMLDAGKKILLVKHNFAKKVEKNEAASGRYCVQFNTFSNEVASLKVLDIWRESCIENCKYSKENGTQGDQFYLNDWTTKFDICHELENLGGGLAPWNNSRYQYELDDSSLVICYNQRKDKLVFYHFQNIRYLPFNWVNFNMQTTNKIIKQMYIDYINLIQESRKTISDQFDFKFSIKKSTYRNPILKFIQNYIMPFKVKTLKNLYHIRKDLR